MTVAPTTSFCNIMQFRAFLDIFLLQLVKIFLIKFWIFMISAFSNRIGRKWTTLDFVNFYRKSEKIERKRKWIYSYSFHSRISFVHSQWWKLRVNVNRFCFNELWRPGKASPNDLKLWNRLWILWIFGKSSEAGYTKKYLLSIWRALAIS
jgi:hypothetical protein